MECEPGARRSLTTAFARRSTCGIEQGPGRRRSAAFSKTNGGRRRHVNRLVTARLHVVVDAARRHVPKTANARGWASSSNSCVSRKWALTYITRDLDVLVAPVELIGLARPEQQRDERCHVHYVATPSLPPAGSAAAHHVVRAVELIVRQQIVDARMRSFPRGGRASSSSSSASSRI